MSNFNIAYLMITILVSLFAAFVMPIWGMGGIGSYVKLPWYEKVRKFIEQLLSSIIGFIVFYYLIEKGIYAVGLKEYNLFNLTDVLLLIISMLGIAGFLSLAVFKIAVNIEQFLKSIFK